MLSDSGLSRQNGLKQVQIYPINVVYIDYSQKWTKKLKIGCFNRKLLNQPTFD